MKTYAFHGDLASPSDLQQDMGDPAWVDEYVDLGTDFEYEIATQDAVVLVGYSSGGLVIGDLSLRLSNIVGAVLYECPTFGGQPGGSFPALIIWNRRSPRRRSIEAWSSLKAWRAGGRDVSLMDGRGFHVKPVWRPSTLFMGHGWDVRLNPEIGASIRNWATVQP